MFCITHPTYDIGAVHIHLHLGHLANAFSQSDLQVQLSEERAIYLYIFLAIIKSTLFSILYVLRCW